MTPHTALAQQPAADAAKDAQIEALRTEVERLREAVMQQEGVASVQAIGHAAAEARAERLAEALRWAERHCPCGARPESPNTHPHVPGCPIGAVLHPTAAQEKDDA